MAPVKIYTTPFCPYCVRAKSLLGKKGVPFEEVDVMMDDKARKEMLERSGGARTVPQIFIGDTHVGGCDELHALDKAVQARFPAGQWNFLRRPDGQQSRMDTAARVSTKIAGKITPAGGTHEEIADRHAGLFAATCGPLLQNDVERRCRPWRRRLRRRKSARSRARPGRPALPMTLAVEAAQTAVAACAAMPKNYRTTALVTDSVGVPIALVSGDNAAAITQRIAMGKAQLVVKYRMASADAVTQGQDRAEGVCSLMTWRPIR